MLHGFREIDNPEQPYINLASEFRQNGTLVSCEVEIPVAAPKGSAAKPLAQTFFVVASIAHMEGLVNKLARLCTHPSEPTRLHDMVHGGTAHGGWIAGLPNPAMITMDVSIGQKCIQDMNAQVRHMGPIQLQEVPDPIR